jgi:GT2 family glycosyltransferase
VSDPRCTIVIPVHGRAGLTRRCLEAILADTPRTSFEIVVVDDASDDDTPALLADQPPDVVRAVRREQQGGFAVACNEGAAAARGALLVFLNNDTEPHSGWLDALVDHADANQQAAAVGAKLLFPDGTVQHAGVAICQDGRPRHIYAGFPADHPAVERSRPFQAVTAACMLVRKPAFEQAGGFDPAFRNSLEDVDLCLRLRELGAEVHYCPAAVVTHLESASRGRGSQDVQHNFDRFRSRWEGFVKRDDIALYIEDGLLKPHYRETYPMGLEAAPELATLKPGGEEQSLIEAQQRHISLLIREVVRLTAHIADSEAASRTGGDPHGRLETVLGSPGRVSAREATTLEAEILRLQERIASLGNGFQPSPTLAYEQLLADIQTVVDETVPKRATVLVISRGDDEALRLGDREAWHFPRDADGTYAGSYPRSSEEVVAHLEDLRSQGAQYLLVPSTSAWWLDHYEGFARHLHDRCRPLAERQECAVYALEDEGR